MHRPRIDTPGKRLCLRTTLDLNPTQSPVMSPESSPTVVEQVLRVFENNLITFFSPEQPLAMFSRMFPAFRHGRSGNAFQIVTPVTSIYIPFGARQTEPGIPNLSPAVCAVYERLGSFKTVVPFCPTTDRVSEMRKRPARIDLEFYFASTAPIIEIRRDDRNAIHVSGPDLQKYII